MTAPTATPTAVQLLDHARDVARLLALACDKASLSPRSLTIAAADYGGRAAVQLDDPAAVDALAAVLDLAADDPTDPYAGRRGDGLPELYSRNGDLSDVTISAYCRRPRDAD